MITIIKAAKAGTCSSSTVTSTLGSPDMIKDYKKTTDGSWTLDETKYNSSVSGCPIVYKFEETTTTDPGLTLDSSCPSSPDSSDACRTFTYSRLKARNSEGGPPPFKFKFKIDSGGDSI